MTRFASSAMDYFKRIALGLNFSQRYISNTTGARGTCDVLASYLQLFCDGNHTKLIIILFGLNVFFYLYIKIVEKMNLFKESSGNIRIGMQIVSFLLYTNNKPDLVFLMTVIIEN